MLELVIECGSKNYTGRPRLEYRWQVVMDQGSNLYEEMKKDIQQKTKKIGANKPAD